MIKHIQKTFKPSLADFAAAHRRLKFLHAANGGCHETSMIRRALTETDEQVMASLPKSLPKPEVAPVLEVEQGEAEPAA